MATWTMGAHESCGGRVNALLFCFPGPHTQTTGYRPIHERLGDIQRDTQHHIHALRVSREVGDPALTFNPEMNPNSE